MGVKKENTNVVPNQKQQTPMTGAAVKGNQINNNNVNGDGNDLKLEVSIHPMNLLNFKGKGGNTNHTKVNQQQEQDEYSLNDHRESILKHCHQICLKN